jgi:hypothetical protein
MVLLMVFALPVGGLGPERDTAARLRVGDLHPAVTDRFVVVQIHPELRGEVVPSPRPLRGC